MGNGRYAVDDDGGRWIGGCGAEQRGAGVCGRGGTICNYGHGEDGINVWVVGVSPGGYGWFGRRRRGSSRYYWDIRDRGLHWLFELAKSLPSELRLGKYPKQMNTSKRG